MNDDKQGSADKIVGSTVELERKDAARYRWLRELPNADRLGVRFMGVDLDTVIDEALRSNAKLTGGPSGPSG